jgi:hypothetical protein
VRTEQSAKNPNTGSTLRYEARRMSGTLPSFRGSRNGVLSRPTLDAKCGANCKGASTEQHGAGTDF